MISSVGFCSLLPGWSGSVKGRDAQKKGGSCWSQVFERAGPSVGRIVDGSFREGYGILAIEMGRGVQGVGEWVLG